MKNPLELNNLSEILILHKDDDDVAIIEGKKKITYKKLFSLSNYYASVVKCTNSKIGILYRNSIEYVIAFFAILFSGNDVILISPKLKPAEIVDVLKSTETKTLFAPSESVDKLIGEYIECCMEINVKINCSEKILINSSINNDIIIPTSGTTDKRKMVVIGQKGIKWGMYHTIEITSGNIIDREFVILSFCTRTALEGQLLVALFLKRILYIENDLFRPNNVVKKIQGYRINHFSVVPSMIRILIDYVKKKGKDIGTMHDLTCITIVGEALDGNTIKDIHQMFPHTFILYGYGMTETGIISFRNRNNYMEEDEFVGCVDELTEIDIEVVNLENGLGEIVVSSPGMFKKYYNMDEAASNRFFTGDIGYINNKKLFVVGRNKNVINSGGIKIFPEEVENVINTYDSILESYVYGMEDNFLGEVIVADIVLDNECSFDKSAFIQFCRGKMAEYKIPYRVNIVEKLTHTLTNKINRNKGVR